MVRQCELLSLCRSRIYYRPRPVSEADLRLMRHIDELHLSHPFFGARKLAECLRRERFDVGRRHAGTLMRRMRLGALYPKKRTSLPAPGHRINPYLLCGVDDRTAERGLVRPISRTCRSRRGFAGPRGDRGSLRVARCSRYRVSNTMAVDSARRRWRRRWHATGTKNLQHRPGSQFTAEAFTRCPGGAYHVRNQHGRQAALGVDNVFVERLWRSVKYEDLYLHVYQSPNDAARALKRYFVLLDTRRPHQSLGNRTPDEGYFATRD